jgi:hypothetical protein
MILSALLGPCAAIQPVPLSHYQPYVCSRPRRHWGRHRAVLDGRILAEWRR